MVVMDNPTVGLVDSSGRIFLGLHGHELEDLEREICLDDFFVAPRPRGATFSISGDYPAAIAPGRTAPPSFEGLDLHPPSFTGDEPLHAPTVLHFNGNGKRYMQRCVDRFRGEKLLGGWDDHTAECVYF